MKLMNTTTGELKEFAGQEIPQYGILSHRWESEQDEVSYKEYRKGFNPHRPAYDKIRNFRDLARSHGLEWAWIDTCRYMFSYLRIMAGRSDTVLDECYITTL